MTKLNKENNFGDSISIFSHAFGDPESSLGSTPGKPQVLCLSTGIHPRSAGILRVTLVLQKVSFVAHDSFRISSVSPARC